DEVVFRALNGSLAWGSVWQGFWAIANWRPFDLVSGVVVIMLTMQCLRGDDGGRFVHERLASLALFGLVIAAIKIFAFEIVIGEVLNYDRVSPSRVLEGAVFLSKKITWVKAKDASGSSFPGDHAFVLSMMMAFVWIHGRRRMGLLALVCFFPFYLPRLVGGAHWATDVLVGGGALTLIGVGLWFGSPLHGAMVGLLMRWTPRPLALMARGLGFK
ncbi:MAG: hypothetical protein HQL53_11935, partial [Magnetococcales bacterium]|nr:hypothetical protein [Magnetococcales bacterium]